MRHRRFKTLYEVPLVCRRVFLMNMSQNSPDKDDQTSGNKKNISLPISRVRLIMKSSPDVSNINQDALFLTTKATVSLMLKLPWANVSTHSRGISSRLASRLPGGVAVSFGGWTPSDNDIVLC